MSRFFGEIRQVAYLVPDIEAAMRYWSGVLGVGPWYYNPRVPIRNYTYRGAHFEPHNAVALANAGGLQIELLHHLVDELRRILLLAAEPALIRVAAHLDDLANGVAERRQRVLLQNGQQSGQLFAGISVQISSRKLDCSRQRPLDPRQQLKQRRFAAPVRADNAKKLSFAYANVHSAQNIRSADPKIERFGLDHALASPPFVFLFHSK